jgi:hypothetical protein
MDISPIFDASQTNRNRLRLLKVCDSPWLGVLMRALIELRDIWSTCCKFGLDKQYERNSY